MSLLAKWLLSVPAVRREREKDDYAEWLARPMDDWPDWVYFRYQADRYEWDGGQ